MQQISCKASSPVVVAKRASVKACALKDWQKKSTAAVLSTMLLTSVAAPALAGDAEASLFGDEVLVAKIKKRVCAEMPTAQLCIPKRTEIYEALLEELKASSAGQ